MFLRQHDSPCSSFHSLAIALALIFNGCNKHAENTAAPTSTDADTVTCLTLEGEDFHPFQQGGTNLLVFLFLSPECPISNRYAPEIQRLDREFASRGVQLWLVYPDSTLSVDVIREHLQKFSLPESVLRDLERRLAKLAQVRVTPEAAVFRSNGELQYSGRIDDWYTDLGKMRPQPITHDLVEAVSALLDGRLPCSRSTRGVGCSIPGL